MQFYSIKESLFNVYSDVQCVKELATLLDSLNKLLVAAAQKIEVKQKHKSTGVSADIQTHTPTMFIEHSDSKV